MRTFLRNFLGNLPFIILAIILAGSVWIIAQLLRTQTADIVVPVRLVNLPNDLIVTKINTENVKTTLQGRGYDFIKFLVRPPVYQLNLALAKPGSNRIKLAPDELIVTAPVLLKSIVPEFSEITIDQLESRPVVVVVPHRLEQHKGIYITEISYQDTVILFGPEQEIRFTKEITSESLFISDHPGTQITRKLKLIVPDTNFFRVLPESIAIIASIEKESTRTFNEVQVNIISTSEQTAIIKPKMAAIILRGAKSKIDSLKIEDIKLAVNTSKLASGDHKIPAEINLPKGIFLVRCEPKLFEVKIR